MTTVAWGVIFTNFGFRLRAEALTRAYLETVDVEASSLAWTGGADDNVERQIGKLRSSVNDSPQT